VLVGGTTPVGNRAEEENRENPLTKPHLANPSVLFVVVFKSCIPFSLRSKREFIFYSNLSKLVLERQVY